jgi:3-deoxy-manno-octulosonate cytidylyltransferase (CMP-KDO synthetase)
VDSVAEFADPNLVKVVCDAAGNALYFSRSPIPYYGDAAQGAAGPTRVPAGAVAPLGHLGIYAFSRDALLSFPRLTRGRLEEAEKLEQLRALEAGWKIRVIPARSPALGVNTPADLVQAEEALKARMEGKVNG